MDAQNTHFHHFGGGAGNIGAASQSSPQLLPAVSAFSAYNLLRSCNYLLAPQISELHNAANHRLPSSVQRLIATELITPAPTNEKVECNEKRFFNLPIKSHLGPAVTAPASTLFGYSHHIHNVLQNEHLGSRTSPNVVSPTSPIFNNSSSFRRQRGEKKPIPDEQKDDKYFERRRRNNQAAKKSRDARKMREDHIALKATILEHENAILRAQVLTLREETSSLRQLLLQKKALELAVAGQEASPICRS